MWRRIGFVVLTSLPVLLAVYLFSTAQQYYLYSEGLTDNGEMFNYQFFASYVHGRFLTAFCFAPLAILAIVLWSVGGMSRTARRGQKRHTIWLALVCLGSVGLLFYANSLACLSTIPGFWSRFAELDTLKVDGRNYYLTGEWNVGIGMDSKAWFTLYECDTSSTKCSSIYSSQIHVDEDTYKAMKTDLVFEAENRVISLVVNNKTVFTHRPIIPK